jgi:hypothetical protein
VPFVSGDFGMPWTIAWFEDFRPVLFSATELPPFVIDSLPVTTASSKVTWSSLTA